MGKGHWVELFVETADFRGWAPGVVALVDKANRVLVYMSRDPTYDHIKPQWVESTSAALRRTTSRMPTPTAVPAPIPVSVAQGPVDHGAGTGSSLATEEPETGSTADSDDETTIDDLK